MQVKLARWGALTLAMLSAGCIYTDRSKDYQQAGSVPAITLPEDVNSAPLEPLYPIPPVEPQMEAFLETDLGGESVPRPEPMSAEREAAKVKIQKVGERQWVLVEAPASQVWPLAQSYLSQTGIEAARSDAASGLIETDWLQFKNTPDERSRYRVRIEKGVRPESTEVHVLHHSEANSAPRSASWPEDSTSEERESWLLEGVANALAQGIGNKSASLLGQVVGGQSKADLAMIDEEPTIVLRLDPERAWATLAYGLQKDGFIRWQDDERRGLFYFQFTGAYQKPNWFVRLFTGWRNDKPVAEAPVSMTEALQHLADTRAVRADFANIEGVAFGDPLAKGAGYLLLVEPRNGSFVVRVRDYTGQKLEPLLAKKLLATLRRNLI